MGHSAWLIFVMPGGVVSVVTPRTDLNSGEPLPLAPPAKQMG
jgi:hypothetical protein